MIDLAEFKPLALKTCLQCGETQESIDQEQLSCAIIDGYWQREASEEWDEHHLDDWSDEELIAFGIPVEDRGASRRHQLLDLRVIANMAICDREGHALIIDETCMRCFRSVAVGRALVWAPNTSQH